MSQELSQELTQEQLADEAPAEGATPEEADSVPTAELPEAETEAES